MTTVPKAGDPPPPNKAGTTIVSDAMSGNYGRPASGGPPVAGKQEGNPPSNPPSGVIPSSATAYSPPGPSAPTAAGTQAGPEMGHGATIVIGDSGDRPSGGKASADSGTVGQSVNQGGVGGNPPTAPRTDFPKSPDLP